MNAFSRETVMLLTVFVSAGTIAVLVRYLSLRQELPFAGLLVMLPVNTLIGWSLIARSSGTEGLRKAMFGSALGLATLVVLVSTTAACISLGLESTWAILIGLVAWLVAAMIVAWITSGGIA